MHSLILSLWVSPAGKSAVYAPDTFTIMALPFRCGNKNNSGLVAVEAPNPPTMSAGRGFVDLLSIGYSKNPPTTTTYFDNLLKTGSFTLLIKIPIEYIEKLCG